MQGFKKYEKYVEYIPNFVRNIKIRNILDEVQFLPKEKTAIKMFGKKINIPREQCSYGDKGLIYTYSGVDSKSEGWNKVPNLLKIKNLIIEKLGIPINFVLVNLYKDGNDYIGFHSDDEKDLNHNFPIISISFGETRKFVLRSKMHVKIKKLFYLKNGDCIIMKKGCQKKMKHSILKEPRIKGKRINLTFRVLKKRDKPFISE